MGEQRAGGAGRPSRPAAEELTFEEIMAALEELTQLMSSGDIGIEEATELYERAEGLHALASERLARVQTRIDKLAADRRSGGDDLGLD